MKWIQEESCSRKSWVMNLWKEFWSPNLALYWWSNHRNYWQNVSRIANFHSIFGEACRIQLNNWFEAQDNKINHLNGSVYDAEAAIDSIQQYSRRDCLEISGIPILTLDSPANLTQEMGQLIGVTIDKQDISIAHRLPDTKEKKDRFIVKFVRREKRDEFYKSRKHLGGKKASVLPSVACEMGKSIHQDSAMYINESLTQYRSELFGRVNKFKKENKYKFLWTNNCKIYLWKHETSQTFP